MHDKDAIRQEIAKLCLPSIVMEIFDGATPLEVLADRCLDPWKSLVDDSGFPEHLLPLWECGTTVTAYDCSDVTYCRIDLEAPGNVNLRVRNFEAIAADVLIDLWEDGIADDDLAEVARKFEFYRLTQLVTALEAGPIGDYDSWRRTLLTNGERVDDQPATRPESKTEGGEDLDSGSLNSTTTAMRKTRPEWYQLQDALELADFVSASAFLEKDSRLIDERNGIGESILHFLAVENNQAAVEWLHAHGANLNAVNKFGTPVLFEVALLEYQDLFLWLIEHGADPKKKDVHGQGIDEYLSDFDKFEMLEFIKGHVTRSSDDNEQ